MGNGISIHPNCLFSAREINAEGTNQMKNDLFQETEIKFHIPDLFSFEERVRENGAVLKQARTHELNLRFDTPDQKLTKQFQVLRLRQDQSIHLAFKGAADPASEVSVRQEIEFEVSDSASARQFLEALGYQVTISYEKYRTTYQLENTEVVLDELPYGNFVEIEGPDLPSIKKIAAILQLNWKDRIKLSYLAMFNQLKEQFNLTASNLLFDELKDSSYSIEDLFRGMNNGE
jgi:adenylate cyclase, class 2